MKHICWSRTATHTYQNSKAVRLSNRSNSTEFAVSLEAHFPKPDRKGTSRLNVHHNSSRLFLLCGAALLCISTVPGSNTEVGKAIPANESLLRPSSRPDITHIGPKVAVCNLLDVPLHAIEFRSTHRKSIERRLGFEDVLYVFTTFQQLRIRT